MLLSGLISTPPRMNMDGDMVALSMNREGSIISDQLHGSHYEANYQRNIYVGSTGSRTPVSGVNNPLGGDISGLVLSNPIGNDANFVILKVYFTYIATTMPADAVFGLVCGYDPLVDPIVQAPASPIRSAFVGKKTFSRAKTGLVTTINGGGQYMMYFGSTFSNSTQAELDVNGLIIVPPGGYMWLTTFVPNAINNAFISYTWEEVPF